MEKIRIMLKSGGFKSLVGDSAWAMFSQGFIVLVNFATVFVLANMFSPNDYGQFKLITTWLGIALGVGYTGYIYTLPRKVSRNEPYNLKLIFKSTFIKSLPTFVGLFIISIYYLFNQNFNLGTGFFFGALLAPILCTSAIVNIYYIGRKDFKMFALAQNFVDTIQLLAIAILAYITSNFVLIISAYFVATILANVAIILKAIYDDKKYKSSEKFLNKEKLEDNYDDSELKMQKKLNISAIVLGFTNQIDKLLIFHFIGAAPLAIYSIVTAISDQARTPSKAIASAIFPRMTADKFTKKKLYFAYFLLTLFCLAIYIALIILYPFIFSTFFPKYFDYIYLANIASLSIIFAPINLLYLYAQSKGDLETLNSFANINTGLQVVLFITATYYQSLVMFLYFKVLIVFLSILFAIYRIKKL